MNEHEERILNTLWSKLSCYDLADLLFALNYVGFGLGAGCFFQCHDALKYREFDKSYPLILGSGMAGITYLAQNYSSEKIAGLWVSARVLGLTNEERINEVSTQSKIAIEALLLEIENKT